jgi:predicted  nucleic acid-binding Zn-ribbon protein
MAAKIKEKIDASVEGKLKSLYQLQLIDSKIDRLRTVRGELPLEVADLEDTVLGLETRLKNVEEEVAELETTLNEKKQAIKDFQANIKKYESQQGKVRNNREYDAITKEVEFQNLYNIMIMLLIFTVPISEYSMAQAILYLASKY